MFTLLVRAIVIYLLVVVVFRLMGKRQIGQLQPFELVLTLIIADLATIPMAEPSIPILHGIIPLLTLVALHFFIALLIKSSDFFSRLISGKPVIVINPEGIDYDALKKLNISIDDLFEGIRNQGYFSLDEVQYAIVETTGKVSVMPKRDFSPVTIGDMELSGEETTIPVTLISEGTLMPRNVEIAGVDNNFIDWIIKKTGIKSIKEILVLTLDSNGKIYFQQKKGKFQVIFSDFKKEIKKIEKTD